jgi:hypothetical protein
MHRDHQDHRNNINTGKENKKWITFTYTGEETMSNIAKLLKNFNMSVAFELTINKN